MVAVLLPGGWATDPATPAASTPVGTTQPADIAKLRAQLDRQQREIDLLLTELAEQRKLLEQAGVGGETVSTGAATHSTPADSVKATTTTIPICHHVAMRPSCSGTPR